MFFSVIRTSARVCVGSVWPSCTGELFISAAIMSYELDVWGKLEP